MEITQIVLLVFVLLVIVYYIIDLFSKTTQLTKMANAKTLQTIKADDLKNANNSMNFTYSMWIYIDDWNYGNGNDKKILDRANGPTVVLGDKINTVSVKVNCFNTASTATASPTVAPTLLGAADFAKNAKACTACDAGFTCACKDCIRLPEGTTAATPAQLATAQSNSSTSNTTTSTCTIENVPIQKWTNIIISLYGRTLDTYLDGKLVRTCVLPGVAKLNNSADILVTPDGGFSGYTTSFKYLSSASNPQEAYNMYKDGFGGSILGNLFNKYRLKFSVLVDNVETGGFQI
jgi:hypothetical protein